MSDHTSHSEKRPAPKLTVLMASYNGAKTLPNVLNAYCQLEPPEGGWKLVIVDNGSDDHTKEIIASFGQRLPLTYLFESRRGQNAARNTGLSSVSGDLVVFTDDDVVPGPDWLRQLRSVADSQPSFSIFGGPILPSWEVPPEEWILAWVPLGHTFSILNPAEEGPTHPERIFSPNMAIRACILHSGWRFDETIGPNGSSHYAMGSETELLRRLAKMGLKAWHCRNAIVQHMIRASQMNKAWVLARAVRAGRGQYRLTAQDSPTRLSVSLFGIPLSLLVQIAAQSLRVGRAQGRGDAEQVFKARWQLNYLIGGAIEARLIRRERTISAIPQGVWHAG